MSLSPPSGLGESDASYVGRRIRGDETRPNLATTSHADLVAITTEHEMEEPGPNAEIRTRITTSEPPSEPTERAELNLNIQDAMSGSLAVPGRFTELLTDACICLAGVAGMVWGPSVTIKAIESANAELPWWATLAIVLGQELGIGWAISKAIRRKR